MYTAAIVTFTTCNHKIPQQCSLIFSCAGYCLCACVHDQVGLQSQAFLIKSILPGNQVVVGIAPVLTASAQSQSPSITSNLNQLLTGSYTPSTTPSYTACTHKQSVRALPGNQVLAWRDCVLSPSACSPSCCRARRGSAARAGGGS